MDDIKTGGLPTAVVSIEHAAGYAFGCKRCQKIHFTGTWVVGLTVGEHKFLVGKNPPVQCCGEEKQFLEVFDAESEADTLRDTIAKHLAERGSTEGLVLYAFAIVNATGTQAVN